MGVVITVKDKTVSLRSADAKMEVTKSSITEILQNDDTPDLTMNKNDRWKFIVVVLVVLWALYQIYPPTSQDLVQQFASRAEATDATFTNIVKKAEALQQADTNSSAFAVLPEAIGTNDIQAYFPSIDAKTQIASHNLYSEPASAGRLGQNQAGPGFAGRHVLPGRNGYKLSATVGRPTNGVGRAADVSGALSQAVEVLRKRVDALGVAEPVIQPEGENQILIQMPGLAESVKQAAREDISKVRLS